MSLGLIGLLLIALIATCVAFFIVIKYEIDQAYGLSYMKNYSILSQTMAELKQTELEMIGSDVSVSARFISDIVSGKANSSYL
jgi:hypothetical protein